MNKTGFFGRSELTAALWSFRREFLAVGLFSMVANLMMLAPTIYMLQVFDRVFASSSGETLVMLSLLTLLLLALLFLLIQKNAIIIHFSNSIGTIAD